MFVPTTEFIVQQASESPAGYFRGARGLELIVVEDTDKKWALHLDMAGEPFTYYEVNGHWQEKGVTFINIRFEVDHTSMVDVDYDGQPGDLILSEAGIHVVARQGSGFRGIITPFALPGSPPAPTRPSVGFRRWRIVGGQPEQPVTLWPAVPSEV